MVVNQKGIIVDIELIGKSIEQALGYNNSYNFLPIKDRIVIRRSIMKKLRLSEEVNGKDFLDLWCRYGHEMIAKANFGCGNPYAVWNGLYRKASNMASLNAKTECLGDLI